VICETEADAELEFIMSLILPFVDFVESLYVSKGSLIHTQLFLEDSVNESKVQG
jgi:hypothetical protein